MYQITFKIRSAISFIEPPTFDALLSYCKVKEHYGEVTSKRTLTPDEVAFANDLPLRRHTDGWHYASWMQFHESKHVEFPGAWKKRWHEPDEHLIDFGKKVAKVRSSAGEFKPYNTPIVLHSIGEVWFYFDTPDLPAVERLIRHLPGIGKKVGMGYGEIESYTIAALDYDPFATAILRPIPITPDRIRPGMAVQFTAHQSPYWWPNNFTYCLVG